MVGTEPGTGQDVCWALQRLPGGLSKAFVGCLFEDSLCTPSEACVNAPDRQELGDDGARACVFYLGRILRNVTVAARTEDGGKRSVDCGAW
ncbi:hypothetical protein TREES_T100017609 [Tupaia chinensis]|uniref:Uncharacterized protein n=1 Tax=Tupaia chinensis TaxID=246437 RepID=L9L7X2_TUPCH|nr:hypothetical protein TREES_T100017609 [Tupaia chinensis]